MCKNATMNPESESPIFYLQMDDGTTTPIYEIVDEDDEDEEE